MLKAFFIKTSEIEGLQRLDPEYYDPKYREITRPLVKYCSLKLKDVAKVIMGPAYASRRINTINALVPIAKIGDVTNKRGVADWEKLELIEHQRFHNNIIEKNDILLTMTGDPPDVGKTFMPYFQNQETTTITFNQRIAKIHSTSIPQYYLYAFLQTEKFRRRIEQVALGIRQRNVAVPDLKNSYVFVPSDENEILGIASLVNDQLNAAHTASVTYAQAQRLLEAELSLDKLTFQKPMGYTARLSEALSNGRIDADYFQEQYKAIKMLVTSYQHGYETITVVADLLKPNIEPARSPKQTFDYIELANVNPSLGIIEGKSRAIGMALPSRARRQVHTGDIIASAVVGSVDKAAIISPGEDGYIASTGFFHFRPKRVAPEYLLMLVRSQCVSMQFQQQATGGILSAVPDSRLKHIVVPRFPKAIQNEVTALVAKSHAARKESDSLLERAKNRVEQLIEEAVAS